MDASAVDALPIHELAMKAPPVGKRRWRENSHRPSWLPAPLLLDTSLRIVDPRGAARRAQMLRFYSKRRGTIQYVYRLGCRSGHMVGLGSFFASFCRNRVGKISAKRKFQAPNLEHFDTLIGARLDIARKQAKYIRIHHECI